MRISVNGSTNKITKSFNRAKISIINTCYTPVDKSCVTDRANCAFIVVGNPCVTATNRSTHEIIDKAKANVGEAANKTARDSVVADIKPFIIDTNRDAVDGSRITNCAYVALINDGLAATDNAGTVIVDAFNLGIINTSKTIMAVAISAAYGNIISDAKYCAIDKSVVANKGNGVSGIRAVNTIAASNSTSAVVVYSANNRTRRIVDACIGINTASKNDSTIVDRANYRRVIDARRSSANGPTRKIGDGTYYADGAYALAGVIDAIVCSRSSNESTIANKSKGATQIING